ncbi:RNA polymerase sigma factor [Megalodesulfovibrio paquesii]
MASSSSLAAFVQGERSRLLRYVRKRLYRASRMDAEDILSDVLLGLVRRADVFGEIESLAAYVYRAIENRLIDASRRGHAVWPAESLDEAAQSEAVWEDHGAVSPEQQAMRGELRERLLAALGTLSPAERAVWLATEVDGVSFRELAEAWGEPLGTLLSRKHRAVAKLQQYLHEFAKE